MDAWKKLRHPKAHGERLAQESGWFRYCSTVELLHRMIAYGVGYDGAILKTSELGWGIHQP